MDNQILPSQLSSLVDNAKLLFAAAIESSLPVAIWRLPNAHSFHLIIDLSQGQKSTKISFDKSQKGFVLNAFNSEDGQKHFINADLHFESQTKELKESFESQKKGSIEYENKLKLFQKYKELVTTPNQKTPFFVKENVKHQHKQPEEYEKMVQKAVDCMKNDEFDKVVLSRSKAVDLKEDFDILTLFQNLSNRYSSAFVSLVSSPKTGTWMCASPEVLLSVDKDKIFRTIALAGTQSGEGLEDLSEALWRQKEIEEQAFVSRYIINCFKKIRLREFSERGPATVRAANLIHLRSDFSVDMKAVNFLELAEVMLELLHPTSAVCGMPKELATQFILENEGYFRDFYTGYLGTVNMSEESHIFVNLRCMQVLDNQAILYAGGGITKHSKPQKEWEETEMKFKTLLQVL